MLKLLLADFAVHHAGPAGQDEVDCVHGFPLRVGRGFEGTFCTFINCNSERVRNTLTEISRRVLVAQRAG